MSRERYEVRGYDQIHNLSHFSLHAIEFIVN